jgi:hypothetical protein
MSIVSQPETDPRPPVASQAEQAAEEPTAPAEPENKTLRMSGEQAGRLLSSSRWLQ